MKNLEVIIDSSNSLVYLNKKVLGNEFENLQGNIIVTFKNEFMNGTAWLEIKKPDGTSGFLPMDKVNETYILPIKSSLLNKNGVLYMQLRMTENETPEGIPIFKSNIFHVEVKTSLNTITEIPDEYEDWLTRADKKLNEFDLAIKQIDNINIKAEKEGNIATITITNKDKEETTVEIKDGEKGDDYILTEQDKQQIATEASEILQPQFDEIHEEVAQLERDIVNTDNRVTGLQEDIEEQKGEITDLQNALEDIEGELTQDIARVEEISNSAYDLAEEAEMIAKGRARGYVFNTKADMDLWLQDTEHTALLNQGDNLYIIDKNVPDYWWDGTQVQELETQKVDLAGYIKDTDYATDTKGGVMKYDSGYGAVVNKTTGYLQAVARTIQNYSTLSNAGFIAKGTLENIKEIYVKEGVVNNTIELTPEEKINAMNWLGIPEYIDSLDGNEISY